MRTKRRIRCLAAGVGLLMVFLAGVSARANVYASNIRLNDNLHTAVMVPGGSTKISYTLNEPATAGIAVQILSGNTVVQTFTNTGSAAGLNSFLWDGADSSGSNVADGIYSISITAAATGYDAWTNITDDSSTNFTVSQPTGIAVNQNTNSPFYGRVFVGNSPFSPDASPTNQAGILKFDADGSPAEDGLFSTGGYSWYGGGYFNPSPWEISIGANDMVYINDWGGDGLVVGFDCLLSTNYLNVLREDNYPDEGVVLSGPFISGTGMNTQVWMADVNNAGPGSLGIVRWNITADGTIASNDLGTVVVTTTNNSDLNLAPFSVAVDTNGLIYTIQRVDDLGDPTMRVLQFPPYTNGSDPETASTWQIGSDDDTLVNAYGVAVDPTATWVAVAVRGSGSDPSALQNGSVSIFNAADGSLVTRLSGNCNHEFMGVAWDNVGNVYATDFTGRNWHAYSPPGANQATTVGIPTIQVVSELTAPQLCAPALCGGSQFKFILKGQSNVTYFVEASTDLTNWISIATNFDIVTNRPIWLDCADPYSFYRAVIGQ